LRKATSFVLFCFVLNKGISGFVGKLKRSLHPTKGKKPSLGIFREIEATRMWDDSSAAF
jgi:hypothetical protein